MESVFHGESYIDPSLLKTIRIAKGIDGLSQLTKREFEVFIQFSSGKSDEAIAQDLSVEVLHVKNIRSKISKKIKHENIRELSQSISGNI